MSFNSSLLDYCVPNMKWGDMQTWEEMDCFRHMELNLDMEIILEPKACIYVSSYLG